MGVCLLVEAKTRQFDYGTLKLVNASIPFMDIAVRLVPSSLVSMAVFSQVVAVMLQLGCGMLTRENVYIYKNLLNVPGQWPLALIKMYWRALVLIRLSTYGKPVRDAPLKNCMVIPAGSDQWLLTLMVLSWRAVDMIRRFDCGISRVGKPSTRCGVIQTG